MHAYFIFLLFIMICASVQGSHAKSFYNALCCRICVLNRHSESFIFRGKFHGGRSKRERDDLEPRRESRISWRKNRDYKEEEAKTTKIKKIDDLKLTYYYYCFSSCASDESQEARHLILLKSWHSQHWRQDYRRPLSQFKGIHRLELQQSPRRWRN